MSNIVDKNYAPFMEEVLQHMVRLPVTGICVLMKLEDGSVCSDYYNSGMMDKMVYAGVIQQDVTWGILKANNVIGRDSDENNE
jgi:hypothetical protein